MMAKNGTGLTSNIDIYWNKYINSNDKNDYLKLKQYINDSQSLDFEIKNSLFFYKTILDLNKLFIDYYNGKVESVNQIINITSNLNFFKKDIISRMLIKSKHTIFRNFNELDENINNKILHDLNFYSTDLTSWFNSVLFADESTKISYLYNNKIPSFLKQYKFFRIISSYVCSTVTINLVFCGGKIIFLLSRRSPIDAIYFPLSEELVINDNVYKKELRNFKTVLFFFIRTPEIMKYCFQNENKELVNFIRDKRPFHVLCDEFSGSYYLNKNAKCDFTIAFRNLSSFIELDSLSNFIGAYDFDSLNKNSGMYVYFMCMKRCTQDSDWADYRKWLINLATAYYSELLQIYDINSPWIWIGIAGGEKRYWKEEVEGLSSVVEWARDKFPGCRFVFDGWTSTANPSEKELEQIKQHKAILDKISGNTHLQKDDYLSTIGSQILRKIALASKCCFFISTAGTPAAWPSLICKLPGVAYGNSVMVKEANTIKGAGNIIRVPDDMITDIREDIRKDRRDFISYSILPESIVQCCEKAYQDFFLPDFKKS